MNHLQLPPLIGPLHPARLLFLQRVALFCLTFMCIVPVQLNVGGLTIGMALLVMGLLTVLRLGSLLLGPRTVPDDAGFTLVLLVSLIYFLANALLGRMQDTTAIVICIYGFIIFSAALVLAHGYRELYGAKFVRAALWSVFAVGLLNAAVQLAVLANEQVFAAVYGWVNISEDSATHISQGYRSPGLFSSGAAILGTFNALTLTIGLACLLDTESRPRWRMILFMAAATMLQVMAIAISGRTGFVALAIALLFLGLHRLRTPLNARSHATGTKLVLCIAVLMLAGFAYIDVDAIEQNLRWSFEFIYSLLEGEGLRTESTSLLFGQMFFLPDRPIDLLLGVQNFGRNASLAPIDSDAGYIQLIFGAGLLGLCVAMSGFVYILIQARKAGSNTTLSMLLQAFVVIILIVNVKDFYYLQNSGVTQVVLLCFALLLASRPPRVFRRLPRQPPAAGKPA